MTRFLAVLPIVIWHFGRSIPPFDLPVIRRFIDAAPWAVSYFFCLSGFVMVIAYGGADLGKSVNRQRYWVARLARLYPVYALSLFLFLLPFLLDDPARVPPVPLVLNMLLLQAWVPPYPIYLNGPAWALSALVFFYASFPFLLQLMNGMSRTRLAVFLASLWGVSLAVHAVLIETMYTGGPSVMHDIIFYNPLMHLNAFVCGMGGGMFLRRKPERSGRVQPAVMVYSALAVLAVLVLVPNPLRAYCHNGMLSPLWMMILVGLSRDRSVLARVLAAGPLVLLGEIGYGMYILQRPIFGFAVELFRRYPVTPNVTVRFMIYLVLLSLVSWACYRWIEKPAREAVRRRYGKAAEGRAG